MIHEPSHDKYFETQADDFNAQLGKTCSQHIVGEFSRKNGTSYLTNLIKF
jgi:hypothetical protein